jgi:hypothetical protein
MQSRIVAAVVTPSVILAPIGSAQEIRQITSEDLALSRLPACTVAPSRSEIRRASADLAAFREAAINTLTEKLIRYNDLIGTLRAAPGDVTIATGEIAPGTILVRAPVTYVQVGRLQTSLVGAPAFGPRFTVFPAGTEVWRRRTVVFYGCEPHDSTMWCGRRSGQDRQNRPNLQCFIQPPDVSIAGQVDRGIAEPHGPVFFPQGFTVFILPADRITPAVDLADSIDAPPLELVLRFERWQNGAPQVRAYVASNGELAPTWDDVDIRRNTDGFAVQAWGGELQLRRGSQQANAEVSVLTPVGPFSPEAITALMRTKAELHVDAALASAAQSAR